LLIRRGIRFPFPLMAEGGQAGEDEGPYPAGPGRGGRSARVTVWANLGTVSILLSSADPRAYSRASPSVAVGSSRLNHKKQIPVEAEEIAFSTEPSEVLSPCFHFLLCNTTPAGDECNNQADEAITVGVWIKVRIK
jgi:hypothetical protein